MGSLVNLKLYVIYKTEKEQGSAEPGGESVAPPLYVCVYTHTCVCVRAQLCHLAN